MRDYLEVAVEAAKLGGEVLKQSYGQVKKIEYKGEINIVTNVDKRSEILIVELLNSRFPTHSILAEEGTDMAKSSEYKWVIDPLDGTTNYAHDYPIFCVSVGLERNGEMIAGAVYQPIFEELFVAEKGGGAYLNGRKIQVSRVDNLKQALVSTGFPYDVLENAGQAMKDFSCFVDSAQAVRRDGSAALDLCYVAMGRFDGFWEPRLKPWDTAAGVLVVTEGGGRVTDFHNGLYSIYKDQVVASNGLLHEQMCQVLQRARQ
ncbi:MAG: inositol monophosphatase [Acidobacteria bacterium]|nr:inositol monophosphatase [Acidobacteriota bacterium]MCI0720615.1 inositol monophosphatase [Acidobacteriota bacterium]